jgi:hypothetical protein
MAAASTDGSSVTAAIQGPAAVVSAVDAMEACLQVIAAISNHCTCLKELSLKHVLCFTCHIQCSSKHHAAIDVLR